MPLVRFKTAVSYQHPNEKLDSDSYYLDHQEIKLLSHLPPTPSSFQERMCQAHDTSRIGSTKQQRNNPQSFLRLRRICLTILFACTTPILQSHLCISCHLVVSDIYTRRRA